MAALFIANTSKQHQTFFYRVPEETQARFEMIGIGAQVRIPGDLQPNVIEAIVKQHEAYGLRPVKDLANTRDFVGLCYSVDKPINMDTLLTTFEQNDTAMNEAAEERRETTAAAIAENIQGRMQEYGAKVQRSDVEISEETKGQQSINEAYEVAAEGVAPRQGAKRSKRDKRKH